MSFFKTVFESFGLKTGSCSAPGIIKGRNLPPKPTVSSDQPWMCAELLRNLNFMTKTSWSVVWLKNLRVGSDVNHNCRSED